MKPDKVNIPMAPIQLLDHGIVRLVEHMGSDLSIARNARVSYDAAWRAGEDEGSDTRLINYLWKNGHTSPFEAVSLTFEIKAPIFVFRQWHRHRIGWSYNELSARYRELPEEFYVPTAVNVGIQSKDNKQARVTDMSMTAEELHERQVACDMIWMCASSSFKMYRELLKRGVPRELARSVLPVAVYSHMFATCNLHSLFKFCVLRLHSHAQYEIRVYAEAMLKLAEAVCPVAVKAFKIHTMGEGSA